MARDATPRSRWRLGRAVRDGERARLEHVGHRDLGAHRLDGPHPDVQRSGAREQDSEGNLRGVLSNRPLSGTLASATHAVVLDVGAQAEQIYFGSRVLGTGGMTMTEPLFEEVPMTVPVTELP